MTTSNTYDFCVPEAQRLAELGGVMHDLLTVQEIVGIYVTLAPGRKDITLKNALCVSALTIYVRTKQSSGRYGVTQAMIDELPSRLREAHIYFKLMRDKWAAHPVNEHETYRVTLQVEDDPVRGLIPKSVGSCATNTAFLAPDKMAQLNELASLLRQRVLREINKETMHVLECSKKIDLSKLETNPLLYSCKRISNPKAEQSRRKFE